MNKSSTVIAVFIQFAVVLLPVFGIKVGSAELTSAIQTIVTIGTGLFFWYKRVVRGDITVFGRYL